MRFWAANRFKRRNLDGLDISVSEINTLIRYKADDERCMRANDIKTGGGTICAHYGSMESREAIRCLEKTSVPSPIGSESDLMSSSGSN